MVLLRLSLNLLKWWFRMLGLMRLMLFVLMFAGGFARGFAGWIDGEQSGGPHAATPASPTLQETTDWLKPHLMGVLHSSKKTVVTYKVRKDKAPKEVDRQGINTYESVSAASFDGCALTLGQLTRGDDYSVVTVTQVPLDRLTKASWKVEKHEPTKTQTGADSTEVSWVPASEVVITLEASTNVMVWRRKSTGNVPLAEDSIPFEGSGSSLLIRSDNEELPPRLVNAINHAIELCHVNVKPEPF
jgi:hypothetical protein